jgi:hypothetical protein
MRMLIIVFGIVVMMIVLINWLKKDEQTMPSPRGPNEPHARLIQLSEADRHDILTQWAQASGGGDRVVRMRPAPEDNSGKLFETIVAIEEWLTSRQTYFDDDLRNAEILEKEEGLRKTLSVAAKQLSEAERDNLLADLDQVRQLISNAGRIRQEELSGDE